MSIYEIEVSGQTIVDITKSFAIEAKTMEEAKAKALSQYKEEVGASINPFVLEILSTEIGYTGILKK